MTQPYLQVLTPLLAAGAVLASGLCAQQADPAAVRDKKIDAHVPLTKAHFPDKNDARTELTMFGHRPAVVFVMSSVKWQRTRLQKYVAGLKKLDRRAKVWRRQGIDVVVIVPRVFAAGSASRERKHLPLIEKTRPRNMIALYRDYVDTHPDVKDSIWYDFLGITYGDEVDFHWGFISRLGVIQTAGRGIKNKRLEQLIGSVKAPAVARKPMTRKIYQDLVAWRLGEAQKRIDRLKTSLSAQADANPGVTEEEVDQLQAMLRQSEEHYRRVVAAPHKERGYLPEYAMALEALARNHYDGSPRAGEIAAELRKLRQTDVFRNSIDVRKAYLEIKKAYEEDEDRVSEIVARKTGGYDEAVYAAAVLEVYPKTKDRLVAFIKANRTSPYAREAMYWLQEVREEIQAAKSRRQLV